LVVVPSSSLALVLLVVGGSGWAAWVAVRRPAASFAVRVLALVGWAALVVSIVFGGIPIQHALIDVLQSESATMRFDVQWTPMVTIIAAIQSGEQMKLMQVAANAVLLAPGGFLLATLVPNHARSARTMLRTGLAIAAALETTQFVANVAYGFLWKIVDVDDIILNTAGFAAGWSLAQAIRSACENTKRVGERHRTAASPGARLP
jgi:glycopeptide antibiotics resistance protein